MLVNEPKHSKTNILWFILLLWTIYHYHRICNGNLFINSSGSVVFIALPHQSLGDPTQSTHQSLKSTARVPSIFAAGVFDILGIDLVPHRILPWRCYTLGKRTRDIRRDQLFGYQTGGINYLDNQEGYQRKCDGQNDGPQKSFINLDPLLFRSLGSPSNPSLMNSCSGSELIKSQTSLESHRR